jgi:toxin-antitoxin system PIN domain toxin
LSVRALLDVCVLIPLFDAGHVHHRRAMTWYAENTEAGWASCPLTQNGFVRIVCEPKYPRPALMRDALAVLRWQIARPDHEFWPDDFSPTEDARSDPACILHPGQLTDVYLLALAVGHGGRLVTFDRGLPLKAVRGAESRHLVVL